MNSQCPEGWGWSNDALYPIHYWGCEHTQLETGGGSHVPLAGVDLACVTCVGGQLCALPTGGSQDCSLISQPTAYSLLWKHPRGAHKTHFKSPSSSLTSLLA